MGGRSRISSRPHSPPRGHTDVCGKEAVSPVPSGAVGQLRTGARSPTGMGVQVVPGMGSPASPACPPSRAPRPRILGGGSHRLTGRLGLFLSAHSSVLFLLAL